MDQTYPNIEVILIDDGSTDSTKTIADEFQNFKNFEYIKNDKNEGLIFSLNKGVKLAKGKYIARMDADDISLPNRIETQVDYFLKNPDISIIGTDVILIDQHDRKFGKPRELISSNNEIEWALISSCPLHHPSIMLNKSLLENEPFSNSLYCTEERLVEDLGLWARILLSKKKIHVINEALLLYRKHSNSITMTQSTPQMEASIPVIARYAEEKWGLNLSRNFLHSIRVRKNFSDSSFFEEVENIIQKLEINGFKEIANTAQIDIKVMSLVYLHLFFLSNEKKKIKAIFNTFKFVFSIKNLSNTPTAFFKFYQGLFRRLT
jgi:glycosyltransferase involved in cell wall biosynthesis